MSKNNVNSCYDCDCWDFEREGCTMPSSDYWFACPIYCLSDEELEKIFTEGKHRGIENEV